MKMDVCVQADQSREGGAMLTIQKNTNQALECRWMLSGSGLTCIWTERNRSVGTRELTQDSAQSSDRRVA
jgi:hypothetical protein